MHHQPVFWIIIWFLVTQVSSGIIFSGCKPKRDKESIKERVVLNPRIKDGNQPNPLRIIHDDVSKLTDYQKTYAQFFYPIVVCYCKGRVSNKHITRLIVTYLAPPLATKIQAESNVFRYQLSFDNQLLATTVHYGNEVTLWRMDNGKRHATLNGHTDKVADFIFTSDNQYLISASDDETLIIWSVRTSNNLHTFRGHDDRVTNCSLTADNQRLLSYSVDWTVRIWSVESGVCDVTIPTGRNHIIHPPTFCNHDQDVIIPGKNNIQLWTVAGHFVRRVIISIHTNLFVVGEIRFLFTDWIVGHKCVQVWNFATGTCAQIFRGHTDEAKSGLFVRDNTGVVSCDGYTVCIWGVNDGICIHQFNNYNMINSVVYWLKEENTEGIIVYGPNEVHVLAINSGEKMFTFPIESGNIEVSFDGRFLVNQSNAGVFRFLEFTHQKNITHN